MRLLTSLAFSVFILFIAPAQSSDSHAEALLSEAAARAAAHAGVRYAFTVEHWRSENGTETTWKVRFDPRLPVGEQWRLVGARLDDLDKNARKAFARLQNFENSDDQLVYDKLGDMLADARFQEETDGEAIFVVPVKDDDLPDGALNATITLNKSGGYVSRIDVQAVSEFKPNAMVKVKSMVQSQHYAAPEGDEPAYLTKSESAVEGKAMFKKFISQSRDIISDIEAVDPDALPVSGG